MCEHSLNQFNPVLNMKHLLETLVGLIRVYRDQDDDKKDVKKHEFDSDEEEYEFFTFEKSTTSPSDTSGDRIPR